MFKIESKIPVLVWLENETSLEEGAKKQASNLSNLPFAFKQICLMPDTHQGYGMPIGGVLATKDVIIPNAVGVDIGCGMSAIRTSLQEIDTDSLKTIMSEIRKTVPLGFNHHGEKQDENLMPPLPEGTIVVERQYQAALYQLGTLGGGNHFIEIQKGSDGYIWIMLHSGSRNFGKQVADYYNKLAVDLNERWFSQVPKEHELAFLPIDTEGHTYMIEMQYCVAFAKANRELMMERIKAAFYKYDNSICFEEHINIAHNYAAIEHHFNHNVMVHRKGATRAYDGELGIIPGSQGTKSYIVKGLGNPASFKSCSHGAGRLMSRKRAREELSLEEEIKKLDERGIIHAIRREQDLDEAAGAYKDISTVMNNQSDLVGILIELSPLAVIKG